MTANIPSAGLALRSLITADGVLRLSLDEVPVQPPGEGEVLIRVEAAPINPSDVGLLLGPADLDTLGSDGRGTTARIPPDTLPMLSARLGQPLPAGVEGAGVVIAAGPDARSQSLVGRRVAVFGGQTFAEYRTAATGGVLPLPDGVASHDGAAALANPLTALGMVETMRMEGHGGLIHTAAASNVGQMLMRICAADGVPLVNVVRSPDQARRLRDLGGAHVVDSSAPTFADDLVAAISATDATLGFDAVGGGRLAGQLLSAMEQAQTARSGAYSRYGSSVHKQIYIYGGLDTGPTLLDRSYGMAWGVGGWIVSDALGKAGPERVGRLRERIAAELTTTFRSAYSAHVPLRDALRPDVIRAYARKSTGGKVLIDLTRG